MENQETKSCRLRDGATIAVVGAGPAGTFFSILALREAKRKGIHLNVVLFDGKNFLSEGPQGCNMCAGVISMDLLRELEQLGLPIPRERVQRLIDSYVFHTIQGSHRVVSPPGKGALPVVFRGNGPRLSNEAGKISFDDYLLDHALQYGATIIPSFVQNIILPDSTEARPVLQWRGGELSADLAVVASGVSSQFARKIKSQNIQYRPAVCVRAFQAELDLGEGNLEKYLGNSIHVFSIGLKDVRFAAIIPKGRFATVSLVGKRDLDRHHFDVFLASPIVKRMLPPDWRLPERFCFCRPSLPIKGARGFFGDRLLVVGDASMSRYYKNGIDSAFRTARYAVNAVFGPELSAKALKRTYGRPVKKEFVAENRYARVLFTLNDIVSSRQFWVNAHLYFVQRKPRSRTAQTISFLTWNLFTGQTSYRHLFRICVNPYFIFKMAVRSLRNRKEGR